jgi:hypothetical protein
MVRKVIVITMSLFVVLFTVSVSQATNNFNSSSNPAAIADPVLSMIELGSVNSSIYDTTIIVLEVIRGKDAMKLIKKANSVNKKPADGYEYVLVKIKFQLKGRVVSDTMSMELGDTPLQWVALTSELIDYPPISVVVPKPALAGKLKAGESMEGWVVFAVKKNDMKPVMVFNPDSGGATGRGKTLFFKLY